MCAPYTVLALPAWIARVEPGEFFGGVTAQLVSDNLKAGVTKACFYDPAINRAVLHQSPDKRGVPLPVKMVSQLTQTWHSQVRSFC